MSFQITLELQPDGRWAADLLENTTHTGGGTVSYTGEGVDPLAAMTKLVADVYSAMVEALNDERV